MLTPQDLDKMATEPDVQDQRSTTRKVYDGAKTVGQAIVGAVGTGIEGIKSLETPAPVKIIE